MQEVYGHNFFSSSLIGKGRRTVKVTGEANASDSQ